MILAAGAMGLFVGLALLERRHEFATMAAVGASLRDIGAFLWSEAAIVLAAALALARRAGLAPVRDARRDAPARVRPAAGPPRGPLGVPRRPRRRRAGRQACSPPRSRSAR